MTVSTTTRVRLLGAAIATLPVCASSIPASAQTIVETAREQFALNEGRTLQFSGRSEFLGAEGTFTYTIASDGRYRYDIDSEIQYSWVFDGEDVWERDWNGAVRRAAPAELEISSILPSLLSGKWTSPDGPLALHDEDAANGEIRFRVRDGLLEGTISVHRRSGSPRRLAVTTPGIEREIEFIDYQFEDVAYPRRIRSTDSQGNTMSLSIERVEVDPPLPGNAFDAPATIPDRVQFADNIAPELQVERARSGHHLFRGAINGRDLGWMVFDSGAGGSVIDDSVAEMLDLPRVGDLMAQGVGGVDPADVVRAETLTVGPLTLNDPRLIVLDLDFLSRSFGVEIVALVGYDVLAHAQVEIDVETPAIAIHPSGAANADARWIDAIRYGRHPCVQASVEGHEGIYRLDTGAARATVSFHAPAVKRMGLLEDRQTEQSSAGGVGGRIQMRRGQVREFKLAGETWTDLSVQFATENEGAFSDPFTDGNVGGRVLERFTLIFDYPADRIGFVPKADAR